ncbi:MAG: steroid delta-isomerase [Flavobacteriaceae bacterium]|nr:steroid delta-isomerase [Flavobacteriaceae bacterium]|tara:strand:+ start:56092 stop:57627 length:1536 start_codon:yes stop_codon:yes gene_type:complete
MKRLLLFLTLLSGLSVTAQQDAEVFLMKVENTQSETWEISDFKNISGNEGYDNQPSFLDPNNVTYAGTRNGATDIAVYNIPSGQHWWLNVPTEGGEYSPQIIPEEKAVAAVRLDPDGLQRLYKYPFGEQPPSLLFEELQVAYFAFYDRHTLLSSVLNNGELALVMANLKTQQVDTLFQNSGRSIHKVPKRNAMTYTLVNEDGNHDIYWYDMDKKESFFVCQLPIGIQDYAWIDEDRMILGSNTALYLYDTLGAPQWKKVAELKNYKLENISRISANIDGTMIALAATSNAKPPIEVIEKQVASYNAKDLESFSNCFAEDVLVRIFPDQTLYEGRQTLKSKYADYYNSVSSTSVAVTNRIALNGYVVDAETATDNGKKKKQVAIYQVNNGEIKTMSFIFENNSSADPEVIVDKQLDAYNARNIDAFVNTYSQDVQLFNFPHTSTAQGHEQLRKNYADFFAQTPDLHCEIKNRIVIGNVVIDEEYITMNGTYFSAIAIYEVENGVIQRVTFLR